MEHVEDIWDMWKRYGTRGGHTEHVEDIWNTWRTHMEHVKDTRNTWRTHTEHMEDTRGDTHAGAHTQSTRVWPREALTQPGGLHA